MIKLKPPTGEEHDVYHFQSIVTAIVRRATAPQHFAVSVLGQMNASTICLPQKYD
jgi:hypothetical protein